MTVEQAAQFTQGKLQKRPDGWKPVSIRRAARLGLIIGAVQFGKSWMIPEDGLLVWMEDEITHRAGRKN